MSKKIKLEVPCKHPPDKVFSGTDYSRAETNRKRKKTTYALCTCCGTYQMRGYEPILSDVYIQALTVQAKKDAAKEKKRLAKEEAERGDE